MGRDAVGKPGGDRRRGIREDHGREVEMKQKRRATRKQKDLIKSSGWNPDNWFVERDTPIEMVIVHRHTNSKKTIAKGA